MYCPNCGQKIKEAIKFCPYCGKKIQLEKKDEITDQKTKTAPTNWQSKIFSLSAGECIKDRYEIISTIGKGSYGLVYKAKDLILNEIIVIKFLKPQLPKTYQNKT